MPMDKAGDVPSVTNRGKATVRKPVALPVSVTGSGAASGSFGLFTPAQGGRARATVLFLSPFGVEDMCCRKLFRIMAEDLAEEGLASLRFDYPGTGDALDPPEASLDLWREMIVAAAARLRQLSEARPLILLGHGLGAGLALDMAGRLDDVSAVVAMAPVGSGRAYLRELQVWSQMIDDGLSLGADQRLSGVTAIGGHILPPPIADALKKTDFATAAPGPDISCLFVNRPDRPADQSLSDKIEQQGAHVERLSYAGFETMVANPASSRPPLETGRKVVGWIARHIARDALGLSPVDMDGEAASGPARLQGDDCVETALRFGKGDRLYGILCEPHGPRRGATVLLLGTAYDRQCGWGRATTLMARRLAGEGIASLRFDAANVGDSPPVPGLADQVLYADSQYADVAAALALLDARRLLPAIAVGRCSGAYLGFRALVKDERLSGACLANPYVFHWDPELDPDTVLSSVPRALGTYGKLLLQRQTLSRLARGEVNLGMALRNIAKVGFARLLMMRGLRMILSKKARLEHRMVRAAFGQVARRGARLRLLYSENDVGLDHFHRHFGRDGHGLKRYPAAHLAIIGNADHNLSTEDAKTRYYEEVLSLALSFSAAAYCIIP